MDNRLAIEGGTPIRTKLLPYGHQWVQDDDIDAVVGVLRSDWLTTGPRVQEFEQVFAATVGANQAVAVSSGTAGLHAAAYAAGLGPGDEAITSTLTFAATANCIIYQGARPVFADVDPHTLLLDPAAVEAKITSRTKAIIAVDYGGQPCDYDALQNIASRHSLLLIADACHSLGATDNGRPVGSLADLTVFSLHAVKPITAGEGGIVTTNDPQLARRMQIFRNHGITSDHRQRDEEGSWFYEMVDLGFNYRLTDVQCALALSQLRKLPDWVARRREIAGEFDRAFEGLASLLPQVIRAQATHAYHLYVVQLVLERLKTDRATIFRALRAEGIGVNVHYVPVHLHPYYRKKFGTGPGLCPFAEQAYEKLITLPLFPRMGLSDVSDVIDAVHKIARRFSI